MTRAILVTLTLTLATPVFAAKPSDQPPPSVDGWYPGPQIGTTNYSPGVVLYPLAGGVLQTDIPAFTNPKSSANMPPQLDALVKPVTMLPDTMTVAYQLFAPVKPSDPLHATEPPTISVMFQRCGDDWKGTTGTTEFYRWYYNPVPAQFLPGSNIFSVDFTNPAPWSDVWGRRASDNLAQFNMARLQPCSVSLVFGFQNGGLSHGVAGVNGPAHFNLLGAM